MQTSSEDWSRLLSDYLGDDDRAARAAAQKFSGVIEGTLRAAGAYGRRASCEDLIQDVLLSLLEHGRAVQHPRAWLRRATQNAYIDLVRRESTRSAGARVLGELASLREPHVGGLLEVSVVVKQELEELREAVACLPEPLRCVIDAVFPSDPARETGTLAAAAIQLGLRLHTVKNRLRRAIGLLGRELRRARNMRRAREEQPWR